MAQWINLNWNSRSVLASRYSVLCEKIGPILKPQGGRPADEIQVDFEIVKLHYRLNYSDFYFV